MEVEDCKRTRVYVMGGRGHGKTTVINLLLDQMNAPSDRGDISVYTGRLFTDTSKEERLGAELHMDMWELPGSKLLRALYPVLLTEPAIYLVLVTADTQDPDVEVLDICRYIMYKIHKPHIIAILTKTNLPSCQKINIGDICRRIKDRWNEVVGQYSQENTSCDRLASSEEVTGDEAKQPAITENNFSLLVHPFNSTDTQMLQQLRKSLLACASWICSDVGYDLSIKPRLLQTFQYIHKKNKEHLIFVTKEQLPYSYCNFTEQALNYLLKKDYVREFHITTQDEATTVFCVDPLAFSNLMLRSHLDAGGHVFRLEAGKFWPSNMNRTPPNPTVVAGVLENLQTSGMVPESFLPLLWNTPYIRMDQITLALGVMESLGLICHANTQGQAIDPTPELDMPFFTYLSGTSMRQIMLMNKLPETKPSLHWSENPHKGDFQISVHFCCKCAIPLGIVLRILALCLNLTRPFTQYSYVWQQGVLIQLGKEVRINVKGFTKELQFIARVVTDSYSDLKTATQVLWMTVAPCLVHLLNFLASLPGLVTEKYLSFRGDPNFDEVFRKSVTDRRLKIDQLVSKQLSQTESMSSKWLIPFKVDNSVTSFETWLAFLMANRNDVLQTLSPELLYPPDSNTRPGTISTENIPRKTTKKTCKVSWDIENKNTETKKSPNKTDPVTQETVVTTSLHQTKLASRKKRRKHVLPIKHKVSPSHKGAVTGFDEETALKVASCISATVLSASVARFMEDENRVNSTWSPEQVLAVREISQLSSSVWEGDMTKFSAAISHAVEKNKQANDIKAAKPDHSPTIQSTRFCVLL
ncbi:uncharacterized protein LOC132546528 [Ylistrum balloti]|uniref:uncharacterized protein LOC132546528 n=1 Tax=Ylistrum balloti TaxID=509963 RepID=UPI002905B25E|nr:uncharacterized protein LOC132546528 [Ylistrum balloti]